MATQLFRQEVIEAGRQRLTGTVVAAVPPRSRLYTLLVLGFFAILAALLILGQYATSAKVRGIVAYDAGIARVYPASQAEIRAIHVRTGQQVAAGQPLVTISLAQGSNGISSQLAQLGNQDSELARQQELAGMMGSTETRGLAQQRSSLGAAIASLERQRSIAAGQIGLAEAATRRATQLAGEGAGTQRQVEDSRATLLARRSELESINERLIVQREALRAIDNQIAERSLEASRSQSVIGAQRAALGEQREALLRTHELVLTAPVAGEVGDVSVEVGQRARPDMSLVTIVPGGSRLEVWLYAPSRAIGHVRPGQEVRLLFDAFPYQTYGAGTGRVTEVSRVPTEPGSLDAQLGIEEPVFRIRVAIDRMAPRAAAADRQLRPGMTLSANLVLERRRLWEVFFNPFVGAVTR
ncbi:HlyD family secretion protein [Allosphingosinicella sp.]|jgi:membrane fusion protein|uniref:HlyD family secretion protein n=1 Tax=Allosphingosinicella sp. TaxID=2823234 RepID=UPI002EDCA5D5